MPRPSDLHRVQRDLLSPPPKPAQDTRALQDLVAWGPHDSRVEERTIALARQELERRGVPVPEPVEREQPERPGPPPASEAIRASQAAVRELRAEAARRQAEQEG